MFEINRLHFVMISSLSAATYVHAQDIYITPDSTGTPVTLTMNIAGNVVVEADTELTTGQSVFNEAAISGSLINYGKGSAFVNGSAGGEVSRALIQKDMINASSATAYLLRNDTGSNIQRNMINEGSITATLENSGLIGGSLLNSGTISGLGPSTILNTGTIVGNLENSGTINGGLTNSGRIDEQLLNTGTIKGNVTNVGNIKNGIVNSGTVDGNILTGDASLELLGNSAAVTGTISGSNASSLSVGNASTASDYSATAGNNASMGEINISSGSRLTLKDNVTWTAASSDADAISNSGVVTLSNVSSLNGNLTNSGTLSLSEEKNISARVNGNVTNKGDIILNPTSVSAGNTLYINGDYIGVAGSSVSLGAVLGDDSSLTDRLVISGNTSGTSSVLVANENGSGAQTLEGIRLIEVYGTSAGTFTQGNRIVAGAYDYSLIRGSNGWYLTSAYVDPTPTPTPTTQAIRPEAASYASNLQAANSLFAMSLHDREGESRYDDETGGLWLRQTGGRNKTRMADGQNKTAANRYVVQLGSSVWQTATGNNGLLDTGIMAGYATQTSHTRNSLTGYRSKGSVDGYSTGLYATWYQDAQQKSGLYVDSWLQYAWFDNEVKGDDLAPETYNSRGLMASAETGYNWQVTKWASSQGMEQSVWLQPHAQAIWSGVKADDHTESNGTRVQATGEDNVQLRMGLRAYINSKSVLDNDTPRVFQPYVEANWLYNTEEYGTELNGERDNQKGSRNVGELKAGVEGRIASNLALWGGVAQVIGGAGYRDTQGNLGIRYNF